MISFIGGTGPEGRGLALRFALAGEKVFIGSRDSARGIEVAEKLNDLLHTNFIEGGGNEEASHADTIVIATPYQAQKDILQSLKPNLNHKTIINVIAPLTFSKSGIKAISVKDGSAALECQKILSNSLVVSAFNNISAHDLLKKDKKNRL
jgi:NADPH-dependent F420 reductase